ncbi:uncharacterized protein B0P05DRAFT_558522, partial [Gilbertella persicaria]|uniref:uncharacterized protein n=1 Tax=Gilbertella persicaria TaxID=101096 RepID=UPI002220DA65
MKKEMAEKTITIEEEEQETEILAFLDEEDDLLLKADIIEDVDPDLEQTQEVEEEKLKFNQQSPRETGQKTPKPETEETQKKSKSKKKIAPIEQEEETEEEFEIERIEGHRIYKGKVVNYEIKWKGYPSSENTTEKANTIHADVYDLCAAYWDSLPDIPRPSNAPISKKPQQVTESRSPSPQPSLPPPIPRRPKTPEPKQAKTPEPRQTKTPEPKPVKRPVSAKRVHDEDQTEAQTKRLKKYTEHVPDYMFELGYAFPTNYPTSNTNWSQELNKVCVQASPVEPKIILCYIEWNNGRRTIHPMKDAHEHIPMKLIKYYEERLQFI